MLFDNNNHPREASVISLETDRSRIDEILACLSTRVDSSAENNRVLPILEDEVEVDIELSLNHWDLKPGRYTRLTISSADFQNETSRACLVFEPFFSKNDNINDRDLSWVYKTVTSCNGSIAVRNDINGRTTFEVFLPITTDLAPHEELVSTCVKDIIHKFGMTA